MILIHLIRDLTEKNMRKSPSEIEDYCELILFVIFFLFNSTICRYIEIFRSSSSECRRTTIFSRPGGGNGNGGNGGGNGFDGNNRGGNGNGFNGGMGGNMGGGGGGGGRGGMGGRGNNRNFRGEFDLCLFSNESS